MVASKYYVYGGGRWRELDTESGRVSGWRGARLCVARRGRVAVQRGSRRARLLAALRALAAGRASHARDGPRLHQHQTRHGCARSARARSPSGGSSRCRCCCHHNGHRCEGKPPPAPATCPARSQQSMTSDACTQAGPPPHPLPRLAFLPSTLRSSPHVKTKVKASTPIEKDNAIAIISNGSSWRHNSHTSSDSVNPSVNNKNASPSKKPNSTHKRKRILSNSNSTESSQDVLSPSQSILKKDYNAKYLRPRKVVRRTSPTRVSPTQDRPPRIRTRVIPGRSIQVSSDDENKDPKVNPTTLKDNKVEEQGKNKSIDIFTQQTQRILYRELVISEEDVVMVRQFMMKSDPTFDLYLYDSDEAYKARFFYSINPLVSIARCPRIAAMLEGQTRLSLQQFASQLGLRSVSDATSPGPARRNRTRRTNVVYGHDTESSEDKENFETSIKRSLRNQSDKPNDVKHNRDTEINSDSSEDKDTSIRRSERQNRSNQKDDRQKVNNVAEINLDSSEDEDKIRRETSIQRSDRRHTNKQNRDRQKENHLAEINSDSSESKESLKTRSDKHNRSKKNDVRQKVKLVADIDTDSPEDKENFETSIRRSLRHNKNLKRKINDNTEVDDDRRKRQKRQDKQETDIHNRQNNNGNTSDVQKKHTPTPNEDFRSKEYSSLEDHTIVAWISQHNRARFVNGNKVWRLLEVSYEKLAGRVRSWHSLRNRYLRYLLPTLGKLELPQSQQTRLRAAAALGGMKSKKLPQRRASIFGEPPVRGASSRKPGPPPETPVRQSPRKPDTRERKHSDSGVETPPASDPRPSRSDKKPSKSGPSKPARSPRYSEVTRQFAARHRHTSSSSDVVEPREPRRVSTRASRRSSSSESETELRRPTTRTSGVGASGTKTRQLYNPNKL